jgi:hypothetical protein
MGKPMFSVCAAFQDEEIIHFVNCFYRRRRKILRRTMAGGPVLKKNLNNIIFLTDIKRKNPVYGINI